MEIKDSYQDIFGEIKRIMVVLAHPDDAEIVAGGLITRLIKDGKEVRLIVTTNGGKGMQDKKGISESEFAALRLQDQKDAGKTLGIDPDQNHNLEVSDGEFENTLENIGKVVYHIRDFKPEIVITHNPTVDIINFNNEAHWVNHRDHRLTGQTVLDACYPYSRDRGFYVDQLEQGLEPHSVTKVLLSDSYTHPETLYFDITDFTENKKKAIQNHGNAIDPSYAQDYVDENKYGDRYFEPLRYIEIY